MRCVHVLPVSLLAVLLTACGQQPAEHLAATLAADAVRLKALRARCAADRQAVGEDACRAAADASGGASSPATPGRTNTARWPTCHRSRRASTRPPMTLVMRRSPLRRTRHE